MGIYLWPANGSSAYQSGAQGGGVRSHGDTARKIMLGIPNYAYDWILPFEKGITRATGIGNEYAVQIAAKMELKFNSILSRSRPIFIIGTENADSMWFGLKM